MIYTGKDLNREKCEEFINNYCDVIKNLLKDDNKIVIEIVEKNNSNKVARIDGFLYNYKNSRKHKGNTNALHIKSLGTLDGYRKKGISTYLVKEIIKYAESKNVKHVTTYPRATSSIISQADLEEFYKKFSFSFTSILMKKEGKIEFKSVED